MNILKKYNNHLLKKGFNGPLSFHQPFKLGHILTFSRRAGFEVVGHIKNDHFGLTQFKAKEKSGKASADIDFGSETGVNVEVKIKGDAEIPNSRLGKTDAGLVIEFNKSASYLLKTEGTTIKYIENVAELGELVKDLYKNSNWNRNWFVITQLVEAARVTLLISKSSEAKLELKAKGSVSSVSEEDLVNADINFSVLSKKEMNTNIIGKQGPYYPLFKANGVKVRRLFPGVVGSPFEAMGTIDPMNSFTISDLNKKDSGFELIFDRYEFSEELEMFQNE